jgi:hypothetical protein
MRCQRLLLLHLWSDHVMNLIIQLLLMFLLLLFYMPQFVLVSNNENNYDAIAESFNFAAVGDWGDNRDTYITAENIDFKNPEVVLGLGDYPYEEDADDIRLWWDRIEMVHDDEIFIGALGNHDSDEQGDDSDNQDEDVYLELFQQNSNQRTWTYSLVYNGVLFIAINTEEEATDEEQKERIIDMLKGHITDVNWKVVFFHKPILTSRTTHDVEEGFVEEYCQIFQENGVNLVLQAHNHNYQRSTTLDCRDDEFVKSEGSNGFTIVTIGTGGRSLYDLRNQSPLIVRQYDDRFGFLNVDIVNNTQMKAQFIDSKNSQIADSFIINKADTRT